MALSDEPCLKLSFFLEVVKSVSFYGCHASKNVNMSYCKCSYVLFLEGKNTMALTMAMSVLASFKFLLMLRA